MNDKYYHCPECGAGENRDGTFTVPKDWPINDKCDECEKRAKQIMYNWGKQLAKKRMKKIFEELFKEGKK